MWVSALDLDFNRLEKGRQSRTPKAVFVRNVLERRFRQIRVQGGLKASAVAKRQQID